MYLVEDITAGMFVPPDEVPAFYKTPTNKAAFQAAYKEAASSKGPIFKWERKIEASPSITPAKKVRRPLQYPIAKVIFKEMIQAPKYAHGETTYILRCLDQECSGSKFYQALSYYSSEKINVILVDDFCYDGIKVDKYKLNLLIVCESVLNKFNIAV
jgi:hypothetical protein